MPFKKQRLFVANPQDIYQGINSQKARDELEHKAEQMTEYFRAQDSLTQQMAAYINLTNRRIAQGVLFVSAELEGEGDALREELGQEVPGTSSRENDVLSGLSDYITDSLVTDLDSLEQMYVAQGALQAELKPQIALERRRHLETIPADDPDRERKADYLTLGSAGAAEKHDGVRLNLADLLLSFPDLEDQVYREFAEEYQKKTGKAIEEMTFAELAERLEVPEEERERFYGQFGEDGRIPGPGEKFAAAVRAKTLKDHPDHSREQQEDAVKHELFLAFRAESVRRGVRQTKALMPEEQQRLLEEGSRYDDREQWKGIGKGSPAYQEWVKNEGKNRVHDLRAENFRQDVRRFDREIIRHPAGAEVLKFDTAADRISEASEEVAVTSLYSKGKDLRRRIRAEGDPEKKKELVTEYLLTQRIARGLWNGAGTDEYPPYLVRAMREEIRSKVTEPMNVGEIQGAHLEMLLDDEKNLKNLDKAVKDADDRTKVSHDSYQWRHLGRNAGKTPDERVDNLAKAMAAGMLKAIGRPFDLKTVREQAKRVKEMYCLDKLKAFPDKLNSYVRDKDGVSRALTDMRSAVYTVQPGDYDSYCASMKKLADSMPGAEGHSEKYRVLTEKIRAASELQSKTAHMSPKEKAEAFRQANIDICQSVKRYTGGKEKVRRTQEGKAAFDSALDAVAEVTRFAPGACARAQTLIAGINEKRGGKDPIDPASFREQYGAEHARQAAEERARQNGRGAEERQAGPQGPGLS